MIQSHLQKYKRNPHNIITLLTSNDTTIAILLTKYIDTVLWLLTKILLFKKKQYY